MSSKLARQREAQVDRLRQDYPFSTLQGAANVLVFPVLQAASIACKLLTHVGGAEPIGPILMGMSKLVYVLPRGADTDDIVNIATIAVVDAQENHLAVQAAESERTPVAAD
jgi:malate dehydrogenase (oxaloacetate-decarboxylating)(NADP+)